MLIEVMFYFWDVEHSVDMHEFAKLLVSMFVSSNYFGRGTLSRRVNQTESE